MTISWRSVYLTGFSGCLTNFPSSDWLLIPYDFFNQRWETNDHLNQMSVWLIDSVRWTYLHFVDSVKLHLYNIFLVSMYLYPLFVWHSPTWQYNNTYKTISSYTIKSTLILRFFFPVNECTTRNVPLGHRLISLLYHFYHRIFLSQNFQTDWQTKAILKSGGIKIYKCFIT